MARLINGADDGKRRPFTAGDAVLIVCVLLFAIAVALYPRLTGESASGVTIKVDGAVWREASLSADARLEYSSGGRRNVIAIEGGQVRMADANCPDMLCVRQGAIDSTPATQSVIVCVPNRMTIRLANNGNGETGAGKNIDIIVGAVGKSHQPMQEN